MPPPPMPRVYRLQFDESKSRGAQRPIAASRASRSCCVFPLLPWFTPQPHDGEPSLGGAASSDASDSARPRFAELAPPLPAWLVVERAPAQRTHLDLRHGGGGGTGPAASDGTLSSAVRRAAGSLQRLDVTGCRGVSPAGVLAAAAGSPGLQEVRACKACPWAPGAAAQLVAACPELRRFEVDIAARRFDECARQLLVGDPAVRVRLLTLLPGAGRASAAALGDALPGASHLRRLVLRAACVGDDGCEALVAGLTGGHDRDRAVPRLRYLCLAKCGLGPASGFHLGRLLRRNAHLRGLDVEGNHNLGDDGARHILDALCASREGANTSLRQLSLAACGLTRRCFAADVARCLADNATLEALSIADNGAGPAAGRAVARALRSNGSLQQLCVAGNLLGDRVGRAFLATLRSSRSLWKLELHDNGISPATSHEAAALQLRAMLLRPEGYDEHADDDDSLVTPRGAPTPRSPLAWLTSGAASVGRASSRVSRRFSRHSADPPARFASGGGVGATRPSVMGAKSSGGVMDARSPRPSMFDELFDEWPDSDSSAEEGGSQPERTAANVQPEGVE